MVQEIKVSWKQKKNKTKEEKRTKKRKLKGEKSLRGKRGVGGKSAKGLVFWFKLELHPQMFLPRLLPLPEWGYAPRTQPRWEEGPERGRSRPPPMTVLRVVERGGCARERVWWRETGRARADELEYGRPARRCASLAREGSESTRSSHREKSMWAWDHHRRLRRLTHRERGGEKKKTEEEEGGETGGRSAEDWRHSVAAFLW